MTQDEIIEMARQAGMNIDVLTRCRNIELLEPFVKLVAQQAQAEEREACLKEVEASAGAYDCTVACGGPASTFTVKLPRTADHIAQAIRARGKHEQR